MTKTIPIILRFSFLPLLFLLANNVFAEEFSISQIKPIKTSISNSYVSNQDNIISNQAYNILNYKLDSLEKATTAEIAIVALQNSGTTDAREISMELFNKWKVGKIGRAHV